MSFSRKSQGGRRLRRTGALVVSAAVAVMAGCAKEKPPPPPPQPAVVAITIRARSLPYIIELPGRIEAVRTAEVRARVDGIVQRRLYVEGRDIRAGAPLFLIDPREKRAALQQAVAALVRQQATRKNAAQVAARYAPLAQRRAVSAQENDAAVATLREADANVSAGKAAVDAAQLQLNYTLVRAPLSGRVGRAQVTEGGLVSASAATLMTKIDQLDPVYATFTESNARVQALMKLGRTGTLRLPDLRRVEVRLILESGDDYGSVGYLNFADEAVDPTTGSQIVRAEFRNARRGLLPGQFVRGRITAGESPDGVSVPQRAVKIEDKAATLMLVDRQGKAVSRPVELGALVGGEWIIRSGLKPGERVIVEGWQKVQPGQSVTLQAAKPVSVAGRKPQPTAAAPSVPH